MKTHDFKKIAQYTLKFVLFYLRPSLAKIIIWPILITGLGFLSPPFWIEIVNWALKAQTSYPDLQVPIMEANGLWGWSLILLSVFIYCFETYSLVKRSKYEYESINSNKLDEIPNKTAEEVVKRIQPSTSHFQDEKIEKLVSKLSKLRFFVSFPKIEKAKQLGNDILDGELKGGSPILKAKALALISRYLCFTENLELSKTYLVESKRLAASKEAEIADFFIRADEDDDISLIFDLAMSQDALNYSAVFMLLRVKQGPQAALDWCDNSKLGADDLDKDGQFSFFSALLELKQWQRALKEAELLEAKCEIDSPALAQLLALAFLTNAIKVVELREGVLKHIPFAAEKFPLADDPDSIILRSKALAMFRVCAKKAKELQFSDAVQLAEHYSLWLELRDKETSDSALKKLTGYFEVFTDEIFIYLPLAFAFKVQLDYSKIESELNRQTALCNDTRTELGMARFVLLLKHNNSLDAVSYLKKHREQLFKHLSPTTLCMVEIEVFVKAGLIDDAENLLKNLDKELLSPDEVLNIKNIIKSSKGEDPVALAISQYKATKSLSDLSYLVNILENSGYKDAYYNYSFDLFIATGSEVDALRVANAGSQAGKFKELHEFLLDNFNLVEKNDALKFHWSWSLFRLGSFIEARDVFFDLQSRNPNHIDLELLEIHLAIYTGNWEGINVVVEKGWENRDNLEPKGLMQLVQLAKALAPTRAKKLIEFAVLKFPDDPTVLAAAYFTATELGWENQDNTGEWLQKATILSTESEGPLHQVSFEDLKNMSNSRRERNNQVYKAYDEGTAPIAAIAEILGRTVSDFYLLQPLANVKSTDIRRKTFIGAFHSLRNLTNIKGKSISVDASSILILGYLDLLERLFESNLNINVSHSLMRWLYDEKQKIAFHQPSQIQKAKEFMSLVAAERLCIVDPIQTGEAELALNVGEELASLIEEVINANEDDKQRLIICSYPVYKVGGLREQVVDLTAYGHIFSSCIALVSKLKALEVITGVEASNVCAFLSKHNDDWPTQITIEDDAHIYLDSLSLSYLMTLDILDKFEQTSIKLFVHRSEYDELYKLRNFDELIKIADQQIEKIRNTMSNAIETGRISVANMVCSYPDDDEDSDFENVTTKPLKDFFQSLKNSDCALIDDRFMNQHAQISLDESTIPIFTTLDFVETLYLDKTISVNEKYSYNAKLREAGFGFVPLTKDELQHHLIASNTVEGVFRPNKELKLIKENLSFLKINSLIKLPRDANWLVTFMRNISDVLKQQWGEDIDPNITAARSTWLYGLLDYRGWSHCFDERVHEGIAYGGHMIQVNTLIHPSEELDQEQRQLYWDWLEDHVLENLKSFDMLSYNALIESMKDQIENLGGITTRPKD